MTIFSAIFFGVLQGLTEFLPVSSSGHLVLFSKIFSYDGNFLFFSVFLHIATLLAIAIVMRREILTLIKLPFGKQAIFLYTATIPTVFIVLLFETFFKNAFLGNLLPFCFMITAVLLCITELYSKKLCTKSITINKSVLIGVVQGIAVLPGISRSGSTICAAILCGVDRAEASRFSFLLSIPIIIGSMLFEILEAISEGTPLINTSILPIILSFITAFISGIFALKFMLKTFQKVKLWWFSIYLIIVSVISLFIL